MTALLEQQYQLGEDGLIFGGITTTPYYVAKSDWGVPELRQVDAAPPRSDGVRFGRDYLGGFTITFDINIVDRFSPVTARDAWSTMRAAWLDESIRTVTGAVVPLRYRLGGVVRRVYGRPRNIAHTGGTVTHGWIPVTAEFVTTEPVAYTDDEQTTLISIAPTGAGGFTAPATAPWSAADVGPSTALVATVDGDTPTWVCLDVYGPIVNPTVTVADQWALTLGVSLADDESVTIDPRPWARSVRDNHGANLAGALTWSSPKLSDLRLPPGGHTIILAGTDTTGTARLQPRWRPAWAGR